MLRRFLQRLSGSLRRFLAGRYGADHLNFFLLVLSVALCLVSFVLSRLGPVCRLLGALVNISAYGVLIWYAVRFFSRDIEARARENRRFTTLWSRLTDRQSRYFRCPNCKQTVRVPRGRGKICIRCPKCSEKFIRKS